MRGDENKMMKKNVMKIKKRTYYPPFFFYSILDLFFSFF